MDNKTKTYQMSGFCGVVSATLCSISTSIIVPKLSTNQDADAAVIIKKMNTGLTTYLAENVAHNAKIIQNININRDAMLNAESSSEESLQKALLLKIVRYKATRKLNVILLKLNRQVSFVLEYIMRFFYD